MTTNRRNFLKLTGLGMAAAAVPSASSCKSAPEKVPANINFQFGIASYSFRKFPVDEALAMTRRMNVDRIAFKDFHLKLDATDAEIAETLEKCKAAGITLYGGGVIYMRSVEDIDQGFEYARKAGMKIIIGVPLHELLPYVEEKVKEYDIKLAIHNHGPGDDLYPSAESAYVLIKDMDPRMGLCIDIGHTKRINRNPTQDLIDYFDRVHDIHIKDVTQADEKGSTCEIGRGVIDIPEFLKKAVEMNYSGTIALEYEKDADDPLPGMAESIGYVRGVMDML